MWLLWIWIRIGTHGLVANKFFYETQAQCEHAKATARESGKAVIALCVRAGE